jgi:hypothetical protein
VRPIMKLLLVLAVTALFGCLGPQPKPGTTPAAAQATCGWSIPYPCYSR